MASHFYEVFSGGVYRPLFDNSLLDIIILNILFRKDKCDLLSGSFLKFASPHDFVLALA
jgi:hypothetical protein